MAKIKDGRWVREDDTPLDPIQLHQLHSQLRKIHSFADGVTELTHDKIEILSKILFATPEQEQAILKILTLNKKELADLPLEELS